MEHANIPEAGLHEPKGVSTAAAGTAYIADGAGSGTWQDPVPSDLPRLGWANYADYATTITPQSISATTWTKLTNDALGSLTVDTHLPSGVTSLWDSTNDQLDFSELPIGSEVELRVSLTIVTSTANQFISGRFSLGIGDPSAYQLNIFNQHFKSSGTYDLSIYSGLYIGNSFTRNNPGEIQLYTDASATVRINGWYIKVTRVTG
jgi:hypothetical protein